MCSGIRSTRYKYHVRCHNHAVVLSKKHRSAFALNPRSLIPTQTTRLRYVGKSHSTLRQLLYHDFLTVLGVHNVKEREVGRQEWERYWSRIDGDGNVTWLDPELTHIKNQTLSRAPGIVSSCLPDPTPRPSLLTLLLHPRLDPRL